MRLSEKRKIVRRFIEGAYTCLLCGEPDCESTNCQHAEVQQVIRDFMNGRFTLEPKRKRRK